MNRALPVATIVVLLAASIAAVRFGVADERIAEVNGRLNAMAKERNTTGAIPAEAAVAGLDQEIASAIVLAPQNGFYQLAHLRQLRTPRQSPQGFVTERLDAALPVAQRAVTLLPASPFAWGDYALLADHLNASGQLPGGQAELFRAMRYAMTYGVRESTVAAVVLNVGLANAAVLDAPTKAAVSQALSVLAAQSPRDAIAIGLQRGAPATVCAHPKLKKLPECGSFVGLTNAS